MPISLEPLSVKNLKSRKIPSKSRKLQTVNVKDLFDLPGGISYAYMAFYNGSH